MYDELIKRIRNRRICIQQSGSLDDFPLLQEAADAIEKLQKAVLRLEEENGILDELPMYQQPVVRARWLTGNDNPRTYGRIRAMCGRCGAFALAEMVNAGSYKEQLSNFCPNCGAWMEES